ncbi:hypothetical protein FNB15_18220 [Ferrovibrio terrae]|uniref:Uncharacterized protein n=1 Tax=Ferrovibrio terrae TaxID=2594003 RepID=A0A516H5U1_9PROT|nr:hypothetical protein [Ferrovibrio terrae]QDO99085.1 hypothetical protein FNB15_18220 [Ferrovibrio terrae]
MATVAEVIPTGMPINKAAFRAYLTDLEALTTDASASEYTSTSTTSLAIGAGSKSLTTQVDLNWAAGQPVTIEATADPSGKFMTGVVTSYSASTGALVIQSDIFYGSGTLTAWTIRLVKPAKNRIIAKLSQAGAENDALAYLGAAKQACVTMRWGPNSGVWSVFDQTGAEIDISASTTAGLQEAIDYACEYGYDLLVFGGGHRTSDGSMPATISCTTGINWPPMQGQTIWFGGVDVYFAPGVGSDPGFHFDSCMGVNFHFAGEIQYGGSGSAVLFEPRNDVPLDVNTVIVDSTFYLHTVGSQGTDCVRFKPTNGGIGRCFWKLVEVIDGDDGVVLENGSHDITQNIMQLVGIHDQQPGGVSLRVGTASGGRVNANFIDAGVNATDNTAIEVHGKDNKIRAFIEAQSGTTVGVHLRASAENNRFEMLKNACTTPVTDDSTTKDNYGMYAGPVPRANVELASNQTIAHNTWTKLALATEIFDKGGKFDAATNYRWTPGRTGEAMITAKVGYDTIVDATPLWIAIYRNGSIYRSEREAARGTATEQGASITEVVPVTATTDYFEIWVRQDSGGDVIAGAGGVGQFTSASFVMLD